MNELSKVVNAQLQQAAEILQSRKLWVIMKEQIVGFVYPETDGRRRC